jgi:tetrahydromethanopterin S-methyltransferase subunit B
MGKVCGKRMTKKILISMKADTKMIKNMGMENFNGVLAVSIKEIMYKTSKKDTCGKSVRKSTLPLTSNLTSPPGIFVLINL